MDNLSMMKTKLITAINNMTTAQLYDFITELEDYKEDYIKNAWHIDMNDLYTCNKCRADHNGTCNKADDNSEACFKYFNEYCNKDV